LAARVGRNQYWRRKKYEAKIDGSVAETRFDAYATAAKQLHGDMQDILVPHEVTVKTDILEPMGISTNEIPFYLDAMREFCRICRNFTSLSRQNECYNTYLRWLQKNLNNNALVLMADHCGCDLWAYYEY
jgi:hypothetical protein